MTRTLTLERPGPEEAAFLLILGKRIRERCTEFRLTQEDLGFNISRAQHYVSRIELGKRSMSILTARALARGLDASVSQLLEGLEA